MDPVICGIPQVHIDPTNKIRKPTAETTHSHVIPAAGGTEVKSRTKRPNQAKRPT